MAGKKEKEPQVWGKTGNKKWFEALVAGEHAVTGLYLEKGRKYFIPENKAGKEIFKPTSPPPAPAAEKAAKGKEVKTDE